MMHKDVALEAMVVAIEAARAVVSHRMVRDWSLDWLRRAKTMRKMELEDKDDKLRKDNLVIDSENMSILKRELDACEKVFEELFGQQRPTPNPMHISEHLIQAARLYMNGEFQVCIARCEDVVHQSLTLLGEIKEMIKVSWRVNVVRELERLAGKEADNAQDVVG